MTNETPTLPTQYRGVILRSVEEHWDRTRDVLHYYLGVQWQLPMPSTEELIASPLGQMLAEVARCAADQLIETDSADRLEETIDIVERVIFTPANLDTYEIPEVFWATKLGEMLALAILRIKGDQLITVADAARMYRVKTETVAAKIRAKKVRRYFNPRAPRNQGRWLVDKADLKWLWD